MNLRKNSKSSFYFLRVTFVFLLWNLIFSQAWAFFDTWGQAWFHTTGLEELQAPSLPRRHAALEAYLAFPDWARPSLRLALTQSFPPQTQTLLIYLLGVLGEVEDLERLNALANEASEEWVRKVARGALIRLASRQASPSGPVPFFSQVSFVFPAPHSSLTLATTLRYHITNPAEMGRLVQVHAFISRRASQDFSVLTYHWINRNTQIEVQLPLNFSHPAEGSPGKLWLRLEERGQTTFAVTSLAFSLP